MFGRVVVSTEWSLSDRKEVKVFLRTEEGRVELRNVYDKWDVPYKSEERVEVVTKKKTH